VTEDAIDIACAAPKPLPKTWGTGATTIPGNSICHER
jgi:hypothetical protein